MRGPLSSYAEFWELYLHRAGTRHPERDALGTAWTRNYLYQSSGLPRCPIAPGFKGNSRLSHELVIQTPDERLNLEVFSVLKERREAVERVYGRPLTWDERLGVKRCSIREYRTGALRTIDANINEYIDWFIDCGERLRRVLDQFGGIVAPYLDGRV